jgi:hypothetical protein
MELKIKKIEPKWYKKTKILFGDNISYPTYSYIGPLVKSLNFSTNTLMDPLDRANIYLGKLIEQ